MSKSLAARGCEWALVGALLLVGCSQPATEDLTGVEGTWSQAQGFYARWRPLVDPVPLNETFDADVWLFTDEEGRVPIEEAQVTIDCRMPAHRHGMLQEVELVHAGGGRYRARGMLCHMVGHWVVHVDLTRGAIVERAQFHLNIE